MDGIKLSDVVNELEATPLYAPADWENLAVSHTFASDLISDILVSEGDDLLLLTSLTSAQVIRTASLVGAVAVVLVHRRTAPPELEAAAREQDVPLFRSTLKKFEACVRVGQLEAAQ